MTKDCRIYLLYVLYVKSNSSLERILSIIVLKEIKYNTMRVIKYVLIHHLPRLLHHPLRLHRQTRYLHRPLRSLPLPLLPPPPS